MSAYKIILSDGTEFSLANANFGSEFMIICENKEMFNTAWDALTPENLDAVMITADGQEIVTIRNLILDGAQAVYNTNGTITGHFYFHGAEYTHEENEYIEAAKILLGEEV